MSCQIETTKKNIRSIIKAAGLPVAYANSINMVVVEEVATGKRATNSKGINTKLTTNKVDTNKARLKLDKSNKYIGYGVGSTGSYAKQLSDQGFPVNTGEYTSNDVVFTSVNGRGKLTPKALKQTIEEVEKALEAGATVVADSEKYIARGDYNIGEEQLAEYLLNTGRYVRRDSTEKVKVFNTEYPIGIWTKIGKQTTEDKTIDIAAARLEVFGKFMGSGLAVGQYYRGMRKVIMLMVGPKINRSTMMAKEAINSIMDGKPAPAAMYDGYGTISFNRISSSAVHEEATRRMKVSLEKGSIPAGTDTSKVIKDVANSVLGELRKNQNDHTIVHELIHAGAYRFMQENPDHPSTLQINELFEEVKDELGDIKGGLINFGYWKTSVDEFLAEALSNPQMINALVKMKPKGKYSRFSNVLEQLVTQLLEMLGVKNKDNVHSFLLDGYMSILEEITDFNHGAISVEELETINDRLIANKTKPLNALPLGAELNEVEVTSEELFKIEAINDREREAHPEMFQDGEEFSYDPKSGIITVIHPADDNAVDKAMYEVYTAHEIRHAMTYEWLSKNENEEEFKYLAASIKQLKEFDPGRDYDRNLLSDRLQYAGNQPTELLQVAELVAILSSEPSIRKTFIEAFPQEERSEMEKVLMKVMKYLKDLVNIDTSSVIDVVDSIVSRGKIPDKRMFTDATKFSKSTKHTVYKAGVPVAYASVGEDTLRDYMEDDETLVDKTLLDIRMTGLRMIRVNKPEDGGNGYATAALNTVITIYGNEDMMLEVQPIDSNTDKAKLIKWYEGRGFKQVETTTGETTVMVRPGNNKKLYSTILTEKSNRYLDNAVKEQKEECK